MNQEPLISIIIPAYNAEPYIEEAVEGALSQTYSKTEVIVVDDGSKDGTKAVLEPYVKEKKIIYIHQENKGLAGARNTGIREAKGEFIAFCDSDDIMLPEKVAHQLKVLKEHPEYGICYSDLLHFTETVPRQFYHHKYRYSSGNVFKPLLRKQFINPLAAFIRREVFEKHGVFDEALRRSEDWDLWLRFAHAGVKFYYLDEVLAHYRMRAVGNLSSLDSEPAMKEKNFEFFSKFGNSLSEEEKSRYHFSHLLSNLRRKIVLAYLVVGDKEKAKEWASGFALLKFEIALFPGFVWKAIARRMLAAKHRFLLKKLYKSPLGENSRS